MISKRTKEIVLDALGEELDYAKGCAALNSLIGEEQEALRYQTDVERAQAEIMALEVSDAEL